jgi:plasmid stability protein
MPTERNAMHIRNVPPELRRKIKAQAAGMGLNLAEWVRDAAFCMDVCGRAAEEPDITLAHAIITTPIQIDAVLASDPKGKE